MCIPPCAFCHVHSTMCFLQSVHVLAAYKLVRRTFVASLQGCIRVDKTKAAMTLKACSAPTQLIVSWNSAHGELESGVTAVTFCSRWPLTGTSFAILLGLLLVQHLIQGYTYGWGRLLVLNIVKTPPLPPPPTPPPSPPPLTNRQLRSCP